MNTNAQIIKSAMKKLFPKESRLSAADKVKRLKALKKLTDPSHVNANKISKDQLLYKKGEH